MDDKAESQSRSYRVHDPSNGCDYELRISLWDDRLLIRIDKTMPDGKGGGSFGAELVATGTIGALAAGAMESGECRVLLDACLEEVMGWACSNWKEIMVIERAISLLEIHAAQQEGE